MLDKAEYWAIYKSSAYAADNDFRSAEGINTITQLILDVVFVTLHFNHINEV